GRIGLGGGVGSVILACFLLFLILQSVAFSRGVVSRGTAMGRAGLVVSGLLLLVVGAPVVLLLLVEEPDDQWHLFRFCPIFLSVASLVSMAVSARRLPEFERHLQASVGDGGAAWPAPATMIGGRGMTVLRLMGIIACLALALGAMRFLIG